VSESEVNFELSELFFSKTDLKGIIESGNSVFVRVSEFEKDELLRRPHNIIRHPDMPRYVFRLFWSFLKEGKPIAAYVKNKSRTGKYYWVFAMAFPMKDGYVSIRLKPSSPLFAVAQQLYKETLSWEYHQNSMDAGAELLNTRLKSLGFISYDEFMVKALLEELGSRDEKLQLIQHQTASPIFDEQDPLHSLTQLSDRCTQGIRQSFSKIRILFEKTDGLVRESQAIVKTCNEVKFVTVNLTISSAKLGEMGRPLSVVSNNLEKLTHDISKSSEQFEEVFKKYQKSVMEMYFLMGSSRLQIEMMNHLTNEPWTEQKISAQERQYLLQNCTLLKALIAENFKKVSATSLELMQINKSFLGSIEALSKVTNGMGVIHVVGKIEMARTGIASESLVSRLQEMERLTETFRKTLKNLESQCVLGLTLCEDFKNQSQSITQDLSKMDRLIAV
jgi:aerotaxis receptor